MASPSSIRGSLPWRACGQCLRRQPQHHLPLTNSNTTTAAAARFHRQTQTRFLSVRNNALRSAPNAGSTGNNPLRASARAREQEIAKSRRSIWVSVAGIGACAVAMYGVIALDPFGLPANKKGAEEEQQEKKKVEGTGEQNNGAMKMEGPAGFPSSPSVIRIQGQDGMEEVPTGNSSVPYFPSTIILPKSLDAGSKTMTPGDELSSSVVGEDEEYQLLGLGIRTVSFLRIQVYVVGMYVAKSDISELQQRLVRTGVNPPGEGQVISNSPGAMSATSLVPMERQQLKELLVDPERGDAAWDAVLRKDGLRTVFRIVPTRNTDFLHLRDGWVRGITARAQKANARAKESGSAADASGEFQDDSFGASLNEFKSLFGGGQRKNVPKGQTLLLMRDTHGALDALFQPAPREPLRWLGRVSDERISRLVWLNYLAGKNVSSDSARQSVVDGLMGIVERPVGTVVQKVI